MTDNPEARLDNRISLSGAIRGMVSQAEQANKAFQNFLSLRQILSAEHVKELEDLWKQFESLRKPVKEAIRTLKNQQEAIDNA